MSTGYEPLKAPTVQAQEVIEKTLENNPDADMRAIPNQWLLNERARADDFAAQVDGLQNILRQIPAKSAAIINSHNDVLQQHGGEILSVSLVHGLKREIANMIEELVLEEQK